jgi:hypothetical protein
MIYSQTTVGVAYIFELEFGMRGPLLRESVLEDGLT